MSFSFRGLLIYIACYISAYTATCHGHQDAAEQRATVNARDAVPAEYVAKPYYPSPAGGWIPDWKSSYAKASVIVQNMTLAEKVNLTSGTGYFMV